MCQILITHQDKIMLPQIIKSISPRLTPCYHYKHNDNDHHHRNFQFYHHQTSPLKVLYHWLVQASLLIVKIQTDLDDQASNKILIKKKMTICEVFLFLQKDIMWPELASFILFAQGHP